MMFGEPYDWLKAIHIIAVISWMAGMFYLPRLFVYHSQVAPGSEASEIFKVMERRLLRLIINPSMVVVWCVGLYLAYYIDAFHPDNGHWIHLKITLVVLMSAVHGMLARYRKAFERDERPKSEKFFRILNEVPVVLMIAIVFTVIFKPL